MHRPTTGQETPSSPPLSSMPDASVHADAPPAGLDDVSALPSASTATQSVVDAHETALRLLPLSTLVTVQALSPPVGLVDVPTFPLTSVPTQSALVGHEMLKS